MKIIKLVVDKKKKIRKREDINGGLIIRWKNGKFEKREEESKSIINRIEKKVKTKEKKK